MSDNMQPESNERKFQMPYNLRSQSNRKRLASDMLEDETGEKKSTAVMKTDENLGGVSLDELKECIQDACKILGQEELILSYMCPDLVMRTCSKWYSFAVENPEKMRPYEVGPVGIRGSNQMPAHRFIDRHDFGMKFNKPDWQYYSAKICVTVETTNVFNCIRFLYVETLGFEGAISERDIVDNENCLPPWWRSSIRKISISDDLHRDKVFTFLRGFPHLHSVTLRKRYSYSVLPIIEMMSSVRMFNEYSVNRNSEEGDEFLQAVCSKSNKLSSLKLAARFSAEALVHFIKHANFATHVVIEFKRVQPIWQMSALISFIQLSTVKFRIFDEKAQFKFGKSKFVLYYKNY